MPLTRKYLILFFALVCLATRLTYAQITSAGSGTWNSATTWVGGIVPGVTDNVVIAAAHVVTLDVANAQCNDLTISGSSATLRFGISGIATGITINGNLLINAGGRCRVEARSPADTANSYYEHKLNIYGNLTNKGIIDLRGGSGSGGTANGVLTTFLGTANSNISLLNTNYLASTEEFNGVTINKTGGAKVVLTSGNLFQTNSSSVGPALLTFVSGMIETGQNIWVFLATNVNGIVGASSSRYVNGILGRGMSNSGATEKKFEIGDSTGYLPMAIRTTTSGVASGHYVYARIIHGNANTGSSILKGALDSVAAVRYYQVGYSKGGVAGAAASMGFEQFTPTYNIDDNVVDGATGLMVAYSTDNRATWNNAGPSNHVTDLSNPPTEIQCTTISPALVLNDAASMFVSLAYGKGAATGPVPDYTSVKYGPFGANTFDLWKANSTTPTPLVIRIHGGGLTSGSKADISALQITSLLAQGISVMSINYRLSPEVVIPQHYMDCARAVQYIRFHAAEYNIDPTRIGATGSSAGGLISFWLGFHDDLADPANADSVLRMSSRFSCIANYSAQTSIDKRVCLQWIGPMVLGFSSYFQGTVFGLTPSTMDTPEAYAAFEMASPNNYISKDDPPVWMYYSYVDTPATSSEAIHHINFGRHLKQGLDSLGVPCILRDISYGSVTTDFVNFFVKYLKPGVTAAQDKVKRPAGFRLEQNYPNPFNPSTSISYQLAAPGMVSLKVYDILGNLVTTLVNEDKPAGDHTVRFEGYNLSSGVYFYQLRAGNQAKTGRMLLVK